ncbi:MAG: CocE/NonD family hydrolase [Acidobacteriota bacterium]
MLRFLSLLALLTTQGLAGQRYPSPTARYPVHVEVNVRIPMRDGVKLATDLYFPKGVKGRLPAIMIRTPYNRTVRTEAARMFAGQGYVVAVQDVRGKFDSEGQFTVSANDTNDGSDTLDWIAAQPWSTGKIGTYGCSYVGSIQITLAKVRNPHHTAMIPQAAGGAYRYDDVLEGGAVNLADNAPWFLKWGSKVEPAPELPRVDVRQMLLTLPLVEMLERAGAPRTDYQDFVAHVPGDPWWDKFGYVDKRHRFNTPSLQVCSWYDSVASEAFLLADLMRKNAENSNARDNQFLVIAPTTHCAFDSATEMTVVGKRELGDARFDYSNLYLRWYDYWLKGQKNGVLSMPRIQVYVMGRNQWRSENEWPLARTKFTKYFLHSKGGARGRDGDGVLSITAPIEEPADRFLYDPKSPVPSLGSGAQNQAEIERRSDVLVYTTPPLTAGVEITGPLEVILFVGSSARDTDFTARLVDVYPDGTAYNLQEGILRARYREGFNRKVWMKPGETYPLKIDLHVTSNYFPAGHRIRLQISSSNFPRFDRNLNTGGNNYDEIESVVAENLVYHSKSKASYVMLPVVP